MKTRDYVLAYGMSAFKLAGTLQISLKEAEALIEDYFKAFPAIKRMLEILGRQGVTYGYSKTMAPFFRKRYYPMWEYVTDYIEAHVQGIEYNPSLGSIERASKNAPIQGSSADMMKLATILVRWYIKDNGLEDKVKLAVQVHDQLTTLCREDFADEWKVLLTALMEQGAKVFIRNGLLKADTQKTNRWSK